MSGADGTAGPRGGRSWLRIALVVSLALNVLILGIVGGAVISHERDKLHGEGGPMSLGPYGRAFDAADREALRAALRADAPRLRETRQAVRAGFRDVLNALKAEPYDAARVAAIVEGQQAHVQSQMETMRKLMLDRIAAMTPEERAAFADRLQEVLRRGPPRNHYHGGRDE